MMVGDVLYFGRISCLSPKLLVGRDHQVWTVVGSSIAQKHFMTSGNLKRAETLNLTC